jgi:hypothetical protein
VEVVRDEKDGGAEGVAEGAEEIEDGGLVDEIKGAGGFVGDEECGFVEDGHGDEQALGHADAEGGGAEIEEGGLGGQLGGLESGETGLAPVCAVAGFVDEPGLAKVGGDGEAGAEGGDGALGDVGDGTAAEAAEIAVRQGEEVVVLEGEGAGQCGEGGVEESEQGESEGGLAAAAFADQAEDLVGLDIEGEIAKDGGLASVVDGKARADES